MKALFRKRLGAIFPENEEALKLLNSMNDGELCEVSYSKKRNYENHKRFFAFIDVAFDNQDFYDDKEVLRKAIEIEAGHFEIIITPLPEWGEWILKYLKKYLGGTHTNRVIAKLEEAITTKIVAKSIDFTSMDEVEFRELFQKCITAFLKRYGNGISEAQIMRIIDFS